MSKGDENMGRFEEPPKKKFNPELPPLKSRVVAYIVCIPQAMFQEQ